MNSYQDHIPVDENVTEFIGDNVTPPYWNMTIEERQNVSIKNQNLV